MATFQVKCGECGRTISPDMKAAIKKQECPYCGTPVVLAAFEALEAAADMERILIGCGERIAFAARRASIMKMLEDGGLPHVEMIPEDKDRVAPAPAQPPTLIYPPGAALHPDPSKEPGKTVGLDRTVAVGQRSGHAPAGSALPREEESLDLHQKAELRAKRYSGGGVEFGHMPMRRRVTGGAASGPGKRIADIPDRPNPLQMAEREGLAGGDGSLPSDVPDTVVQDGATQGGQEEW